MSTIKRLFFCIALNFPFTIICQPLPWKVEVTNYFKDNSWQILKTHFQSESTYIQFVSIISYPSNHHKTVSLKAKGMDKPLALIRPFKVIPLEKNQYKFNALDTTLTFTIKLEIDTLKHKIISYSIFKQ